LDRLERTELLRSYDAENRELLAMSNLVGGPDAWK
jgi:hypothetical protein